MKITQEKFNEIEKEFLGNLNKTFCEVYDCIIALRKEKKFIKSELCIALIFADTLSRYYKILQGYKEDEIDKENEKRLKKWFNSFVFNDENKIY